MYPSSLNSSKNTPFKLILKMKRRELLFFSTLSQSFTPGVSIHILYSCDFNNSLLSHCSFTYVYIYIYNIYECTMVLVVGTIGYNCVRVEAFKTCMYYLNSFNKCGRLNTLQNKPASN